MAFIQQDSIILHYFGHFVTLCDTFLHYLGHFVTLFYTFVTLFGTRFSGQIIYAFTILVMK